VFFGELSSAQAGLMAQGFIGNGRVAIIYPSDRLPRKVPVTPATVYPGAPIGVGPKEIEFRNLLESSATITELVDALRQELL
jgi:hypothetical protein